jgi:hypothetical protein
MLEKGQPGPQVIRIESGRREEVKILEDAVTELQRDASAAIEDKLRRHVIQLRPQPKLRFGQNV